MSEAPYLNNFLRSRKSHLLASNGLSMDPAHSKINPSIGGQSRLKGGFIAVIPPYITRFSIHFEL